MHRHLHHLSTTEGIRLIGVSHHESENGSASMTENAPRSENTKVDQEKEKLSENVPRSASAIDLVRGTTRAMIGRDIIIAA
jgi:hypothetical protein